MIFHSYVSLPEGKASRNGWWNPPIHGPHFVFFPTQFKPGKSHTAPRLDRANNQLSLAFNVASTGSPGNAGCDGVWRYHEVSQDAKPQPYQAMMSMTQWTQAPRRILKQCYVANLIVGNITKYPICVQCVLLRGDVLSLFLRHHVATFHD